MDLQGIQTEEEAPVLTISVEEAGRRLGIGRSLSYDAARLRQIPTIRLGRRLRVPLAAFQRLLECGSVPANTKGEGDAK